MSEIITTEYHTYEYIGNKTLLRDDGLKMKCNSLTGAVFTFKNDPDFYNGDHISELEEVILQWPNDGASVNFKVYRSAKTYTMTGIYISADDDGNTTITPRMASIPTTLRASNSNPNVFRAQITGYVGDLFLTSFSYNSSENALEFNCGMSFIGSYEDFLLSGTTISRAGSTSTYTWDPTLEVKAYTLSGSTTCTNWLYLGGEMLNGSIDQILSYFDYNNGGTWEPVDQPLTKIKFTGQGTDTTYELDEATENYKILDIVGNTVTIQIDGHKTVTHTYEDQVGEVTLDPSGDTIIVTATTKSDPDEISCVLYNCTCDPRYVEKTQYLDSVSIIHGSWVSPYNQFSPTLRLDLSEITNDDGDTVSVSDFNYVKIIDQTGGRFYYVTDRSCVGKGVWDIYLTEDVLMTFPEVIGSMTAMVDRWEGSTDGTIVDPIFPVGAGQTLTTKEFTMVNDIFSPTNCSWVLNGYNLATGGDVNE